MRPSRKQRVLVGGLCALVLLLAVLLCASYLHARAQADTLIAKIPQRFTPFRTHFCFFQSITGQRGPCWDFSYDPDDFGVGPLTLAVTPTGEVVASNPFSTLAKIRALP